MINHQFFRHANRRSLFSAARFVSAAVAATLLFSGAATAQEDEGALPLPLDEVRMFTQALDHIRRAYVEEVDMTELEALRNQMNKAKRPDQPKLTLLPFLMRALIRVLPDYPQINARFDDEAGKD